MLRKYLARLRFAKKAYHALKNKMSKVFPSLYYAKHSYSQEGEDLVLSCFLKDKKTPGFYVDIGAHHPYRFSNTMLFYKKGWSGINIDAMPNSMKLFNRYRRRDSNLEIGVSAEESVMDYYYFNDPALNGFSKEISEKRNESDTYHIVKVVPVRTAPLAKILAQYVPENQIIDFMSIDVEGFDLEVLKSNNWGKYSPNYILIEIYEGLPEHIATSPIYSFLKEKNFVFVAKTFNTYLFKNTKPHVS